MLWNLQSRVKENITVAHLQGMPFLMVDVEKQEYSDLTGDVFAQCGWLNLSQSNNIR